MKAVRTGVSMTPNISIVEYIISYINIYFLIKHIMSDIEVATTDEDSKNMIKNYFDKLTAIENEFNKFRRMHSS